MTTERDRWVDEKMGALTLEQKVGQMLVFGFCGPVITPDVLELIRHYHVGGLRVSTKFRGLSMLSDLPPGESLPAFKERSFRHPRGKSRDYADYSRGIACTPQQYAETLNRLRQVSMDRPGGVPLHYAFDQEGNAVDDMVIGQRFFPHPMGLTATGDPELAYRAARAIGRQCRALGLNMIHSPMVDVNTNPLNPEVGTRAYSDDPDVTIRFALETLRGLRETGLTATAKTFPGRGDSATDAHHGLPSVDVDLETLRSVHIRTFKAMVDAGVPAMMMAHSLYPALGAVNEPATLHRGIVQGLLREELGFEGVIETDNMMMGGVLQKWDLKEATLMALEAGCDLVLLRDEGPIRLELVDTLVEAVKRGRLSEARIDESVVRILRMRHDMGLAEGGLVDASKAAEPIDEPETRQAAIDCAERSVLQLRNRRNLLPLSPDTRVLLVEQVFPAHLHANNMYSHPGLFWEACCAEASEVACVEMPYLPTGDDMDRLRRRLQTESYEVILTTSYYYHKDGPGGGEALTEMLATGKPVVVLTNSPYAFAVRDELDTVVTVFHPGAPEHMRAAARVIFGSLAPVGKVPVKELGSSAALAKGTGEKPEVPVTIPDFKRHDYLIGVDSDGCAFDVMGIKHKECFCPAFIGHFGLQGLSGAARDCWDFANLDGATRGNNRFKALLIALDLLRAHPETRARGLTVPELPELRDWLGREKRLGGASLAQAAEERDSDELRQVYAWHVEVNERIAKLVQGIPPFPGVRDTLQAASGQADLMVVSQAGTDTLLREWGEHGLLPLIGFTAGQELGGKADHLRMASGGRYDPEKVLMVGDAPGDCDAARSEGCRFWPIFPGKETESWRRLREEGLPRLFSGRFDQAFQDALIKEFAAWLPETPPWQ